MIPVTVKDLIDELKEYDNDMEVFYATKYALVPLEVKKLEDRCIAIDMAGVEKHKYKEY